jgi:hypothetical protein
MGNRISDYLRLVLLVSSGLWSRGSGSVLMENHLHNNACNEHVGHS